MNRIFTLTPVKSSRAALERAHKECTAIRASSGATKLAQFGAAGHELKCRTTFPRASSDSLSSIVGAESGASRADRFRFIVQLFNANNARGRKRQPMTLSSAEGSLSDQ